MKKSTIYTLIIGGAFTIVGSVMVFSGIAMNGKSQAATLLDSSPVATLKSQIIRTDNIDDNFYDKTEEFNIDNITELSFDFNASEIIIVDNTIDDKIRISTYAHNFDVHEDDKGNMSIETRGLSGIAKPITIAIPMGHKFDTIKYQANASDINIDSIICDDISIESSTSDFTVSKLLVNDKATICNNAGNINIQCCTIGTLDLECSAGDTSIDGIISKDASINCNVGNINLTIADSSDNHNINISNSLGSIIFNGEHMTSTDSDDFINNKSDSTYDFSCSMGNINIDFTND